MEYKKQQLHIRELAKRLKELAESPDNMRKRQNWADHNELKGNVEPLLWVCPDDDGAWLELIPEDTLKCTDPDLKSLELKLRKYLYHSEHFDDDFVFEPAVYFDMPGEYTGCHYGKKDQTTAWGLKIEKKVAGKTAYHLDNFIKTPEDVERILEHEVDFIPDYQEWKRLKDKYEDAVGGIIEVQFHLPYSVLVQSHLIELVHLRGLEELLYDLYDNPEFLRKILGHMSESKARLLDRLERNKLLFENRINIYTGSGGLGYTNDALKRPEDVRLKDMWGFADAQEFSHVSPEMFEEFAVKFQKAGLNRFGMGCYGCCEPMDNKYEIIFKHIENLRRISISPWSDTKIAAEMIGSKAIYSWKPNPVIICCGFDEAGMNKMLRETADVTRDCVTEIILKDIRTCAGTPVHIQKFINLAKKIFKK
ncbi:MAG TPA: hypothetical protein GX505_12140 [Clostridiales bacterium]|nr:hypothetical protein [Clostridiales bacterium]